MSIFGSRDKQKISTLEREIEKKDRRIRQLESLCAERMNTFLAQYPTASSTAVRRRPGTWLTGGSIYTGSEQEFEQ